jgi:GTP-binding protein
LENLLIFKDEVEIYVKAGNGGDGAATFRREKFIPKGGPDGGDGGDGGNVVIHTDSQLRTLSHIHNHQKFKAQRGDDGSSNNKFGKNGEDVVIKVPVGTVIHDLESNGILADLVEDNQEFIIAKGGRGGRGNTHFKSSVNQTPFYAEQGKTGEEKSLRLELKLIAHIGLVGFPNAGKSTVISRLTNARPKVADYPFTTLQPNLGVMSFDNGHSSLLIADIPGLIEGAHNGKGLGIDFLKHIERTRFILYILDITDEPMEKFTILRNELLGYSGALYSRDFLIALNKIDLVYDKEEVAQVIADFRKLCADTQIISAVTGDGLKELKSNLYEKYIETEKKYNEEEEND